jgi:hypothetical protein
MQDERRVNIALEITSLLVSLTALVAVFFHKHT